MENVKKHLSLLGLKVRDRVTGAKGVVDSVSFDLYGCVQCGLNPGLDKDKKQLDCKWYDVSRLEIVDKEPVMDTPDFSKGLIAEGKKGSAIKSAVYKS